MDDEKSIHIEREPLTQISFDELYRKLDDEKTIEDNLRQKINCSTRKAWQTFSSFLPIAKVLRYYSVRQSILDDILAGIVNVLFHIPHALAFGLLSLGKIENGLYTSVWPIFLYVIFGSSSHSSIGTSAIICMFSSSIVNRETMKFEGLSLLNFTTLNTDLEISPEYVSYRENLNNSVILLCGLILIILGLLGFSFLSYLLSEPFLKAFTSGMALHIVLNQLPEMLGIGNDNHENVFTLFYQIKDILSKMTDINGQTLLISVLSIVMLIFIKEFNNLKVRLKLRIQLPAEMIVLILVVIVSAFTDLHKHVRVVGIITRSIPPPTVPDLTGCHNYLLDCFILALLIYANNVSISRTFAKKHNYEIDNNQEMFAHGICNFVGAFFRCVPVSVSAERSKVLSLMNANSTLSGLTTALLMLIILIVSHYLFEFIPKASLCAIIVVGIKGLLIQIADFRKYWNVNRYEFFVWAFTFFAVVLLNLTYGFLIGLIISLLTVVIQTQFARGFRLEKSIEENVIVEHKRYNGSTESRRIKIFRFQSNLYFANAEIFRNKLYQQTVNPRKLLKYLKKQEKLKEKQAKRDAKSKGNNIEDTATCDSDSGNGKSDVIITYDLLPTISEHHETKGISISANSVTSLPVDIQASDTTSAFVPMDRNLSDSQSLKSFTFGRQQSDSLSLRSATYLRQQSDPRSENSLKPGSDSQSLASVFTNLTYEPEEEDPDDGQTYVTEGKFQIMRKVHHVVLDFSNVNYMDITGAKMLAQISREFDNVNIKLFLSGCSTDIQHTLQHAGVSDDIPPSSMFIDIYDAVEVAKHFEHLYPYVKTDDKF